MNFREKILQWYHQNKRQLPWRETSDPYKIWISEVILQQTRVEQGLPYYYKFLEQFPDVVTLAQASEQQVLNLWKGLGYYTRARNLHKTAQQVIELHGSVFPGDYDTLIKLKGIGSYTAAAISSICSDEPKPAIDGNVTRVLSRYFGLNDVVGSSALLKKVRWISTQIIPNDHPGDYNQAMMEYGARVCTPITPRCESCQVRNTCYAFENKMTTILPVKKKPVKKKNRFFNYLVLLTETGKIAINKRILDDIWQNLWDFPLLESDKLLEGKDIPNIIGRTYGFSNLPLLQTVDSLHVLTHQTLYIRFFILKIREQDLKDSKGLVLISSDESGYPIPRVIENFLKRIDIFFGYE